MVLQRYLKRNSFSYIAKLLKIHKYCKPEKTFTLLFSLLTTKNWSLLYFYCSQIR